jgi:hypothetical protein
MLKIVVPCFGDKSKNLPALIESITSQDIEGSDVEVYFAEDQISDEFKSKIKSIQKENFFFRENKTKKRMYALRNVCRVLDSFEEDCIVGIIDCDDFLWGNDCLSSVLSKHNNGFDCVWTANEFAGIGINFSAPLNNKMDVYSHPWVSSHFKTFKLSDYKNVPKKNFKDADGEWFTACYDQALMLPILHNVLKRGGETKYIDKIHYIYNGPEVIDPESKYRKAQLFNEHFIRSRGYLK